MRTFARCLRGCLLPTLVGATACGPAPAPVFDDDLGLAAVAVEEGALAGTFAIWDQLAQLIQVPVLGKQEGGSESWFLLERTWDGKAYASTVKLCGGRTWPVVGGKTLVPAETRRRIAASTTHATTLDDATGAYRVEGYLELWGLTLPDPYGTPLPADDEEATVSPHKEHVVDQDGDGNPGVTAAIDGIFDGDVFFVQRAVVDFEGIVLSEDQLVGLIEGRVENRTVGASKAILNQSLGDPEQDPNPKLSWFNQVRIPDGAGCADVDAMVEAGELDGTRPF